MPRPIPDDVENVTGFIWYLIPMPDNPVFVQAAWDAFSELTYPWNWGKEGRVPESDIAAQLWADAIYEALRVRDMGFPDLLLDYLDEVEPLLRQLAQSDFCCDALPGSDTIYTDLPSGLDTSDTDTDTSTFPTGIADQSEWDEYICRAATAFVDSFIEIPDQVTGAISATIQVLTLIVIVFTTGAYIGIAGAIGGLLTITGILEALGYLEEIIEGLTAGTEDTPSAVQTELLAVRDDLICDIVLAPTAAAAGVAFRQTMGDAVTSTAWENLLLLLSGDSWFAKIYNHDAETAPTASCDCVITPTETDLEGFRFVIVERSASTGSANMNLGASTCSGCMIDTGAGTTVLGTTSDADGVSYQIRPSSTPDLTSPTSDNTEVKAWNSPSNQLNPRLTLGTVFQNAGDFTWSMQFTHAYRLDTAEWVPVVGLEVVSSDGEYTYTVDGNTLFFAGTHASGLPQGIVTIDLKVEDLT